MKKQFIFMLIFATAFIFYQVLFYANFPTFRCCNCHTFQRHILQHSAILTAD